MENCLTNLVRLAGSSPVFTIYTAAGSEEAKLIFLLLPEKESVAQTAATIETAKTPLITVFLLFFIKVPLISFLYLILLL